MKVGVVGTGHWARNTHAAGAAAATGVEFVGVWGRSEDATGALADRFGVRAFGGFDELLEAVDAVTFAVPPDVQPPLAVRAARAGKHLLLEKPVALDLAAADEVVAAVDEAGVSTLVFLANRYYQPLAEWIEACARERWDGATTNWIFSALSNGDSPYFASAWRRDSGALWDVGPHALSLLTPILGPVTAVAAVGGVRDLVTLVLTHDSGAVSTANLTISAAKGAEIADLRLWGPAGVAARPDYRGHAADALAGALIRLRGMAERGETRTPLDVHEGRDIVAVLAEAERRIAERRH